MLLCAYNGVPGTASCVQQVELAVLAWRWDRLFLAALTGFMGDAGRWLVLGRVLVGLSEDLPLLEENSETVRMVCPSSAQQFKNIAYSLISQSCTML